MGLVRGKRLWIGATATTLAALAAACSLNPQPLPPDTFDGGANGGGGDASAGLHDDGGAFGDAASPAPDGGHDSAGGNGDAGDTRDAGEAGPHDGGDSGIADAPDEGG